MASIQPTLPEAQFVEARQVLLQMTGRMSCAQALELADLIHTVIRMRKPHRLTRNLTGLFQEQHAQL